MEMLNLIYGEPTNIKLVDDPGYELADAAIRALRRAGKWTPAKDADGKDLNYRNTYKFTLSIKEFRTWIF
ncbi:energy transducer TonB [Sphingobacterium cellulitidis]|uniref:energy transducer TonB n=1 Tax=Sphingobacterium cellulitidis TaxID=1768011 RepID=UPI003C7A163B